MIIMISYQELKEDNGKQNWHFQYEKCKTMMILSCDDEDTALS